MRRHLSALLTACLFSLSGSLWAQFEQYTSPGGPRERRLASKESLERKIEESRFRLGRLMLDPWIGIRDAAYTRQYTSTGEREPADFTVTVGAGLTAYLHTGSKVIWTAEALPEYVWWADQADRRRVNGRYGLTVNAFFNRMTATLAADRTADQRIVTPDLLEPVSASTRTARFDTEVNLSSALFVYGGLAVVEQENLVDEIDDPLTQSLALLDRDEQVSRLGLGWRSPGGLAVRAGAERSQVDFLRPVLDRSNEGTAPTLAVDLDRRRFAFHVDLAARSLTAQEGARFVDYDEVTGAASFSIRLGRRIEPRLYGFHTLAYTLSEEYAYLDDERIGFSLRFDTGAANSVATFFVESGAQSYAPLSPTAADRKDDHFAYGTSLTVRLRKSLTVALQATRIEIESNVPGADRGYTVVGTSINLLTAGSAGGE